MRILVLRFSSLGDVTLASAPLLALHAKYPDAEITLATKSQYAPLFHAFPFPLMIAELRSGESTSQFVASLPHRSYELIIDLHGSLRSCLVTSRLKAAELRRVNKSTLRRWQMVWSKRGLDRSLSVAQSYLEAAGVPSSSQRPRLFLDPTERASALAMKSRHAKILGIGWSARHPTKAVPTELWDRIVHELRSQAPLHLAFFGLADVGNEITRFARSESHRAAGITSETFVDEHLRDTMARLAACDAFVSSDSGLMHVADALGAPTFGLFGPTHPALGFAPAGEKSQAFHAGTWCSPCHRHGSAACFRERRFCFSELNSEEVGAAIRAVFSSKSHAVAPP